MLLWQPQVFYPKIKLSTCVQVVCVTVCGDGYQCYFAFIIPETSMSTITESFRL